MNVPLQSRALVLSWLAAISAVLLLGFAATSAGAAGRCGDAAWCDTSLPPAKRADLLLKALTPAERVGLLGGDERSGVLGRSETGHTGTSRGVPRLGLPDFFLTDGPVGVRQGTATSMPASMALASSFNRRLAREYGAMLGDEAKRKGNDLVYAPTVNILRTPLWGRSFETYGEDPFLTSTLAVPHIKAIQRQGVIANVKHFAANNQEGSKQADGTVAGERYRVDVRIGERPLREIYLPAFEAAVKKADVGSVMCSYNRLNGPHACASKTLLTDILRRDWGFDGFVLADYGASKTVAGGLRAGLDMEPWPFADTDGGENLTPERINAALAAGSIKQSDVDESVRNVLRTQFAYGFFDRPAHANDPSTIDKAAHARTSRRIAEAGTVLLKNRGNLLPLRAKRLDSVAVIGEAADRYVNGGGSSNIKPFSFTSVADSITRRAGAGVDVKYEPGDDVDAAVAAARAAEVAVVVVADSAGEFADKPCLALDCKSSEPAVTTEGPSDELIRRVVKANPRTIVVMQTAGPVLTPWRKQVPAIVEAWYSGQTAGGAVARVLFGDVDPGGRLPATFPKRQRDLPTGSLEKRYPGVDDVVDYSEGVLVGYRWFDRRRIAPAFPFGHGLSYTRFKLSDLRVRRMGSGARVTIRVTNRGKRRGTAVPQLYVGLPGSSKRIQPPRQLKGFQSVSLKRGRSARVAFKLDRRAFSYWNAGRNRWTVAKGCYRVSIGESSRDLAATKRLARNGGRCS